MLPGLDSDYISSGLSMPQSPLGLEFMVAVAGRAQDHERMELTI
jgi:hypothetical protein